MDNNVKRIIKEEWLRVFPALSAYAPNKFYKIVGFFICGFELVKLPYSQEYRPHFVVYPLYKRDVKSCMDYPVLMFEFYNHKKLQLNLPYTVNEKLKDTLNIISDSIQISLDSDVTLSRFYHFIDDIQREDTVYHSHSGKIASLLELKFYAALYVGNHTLMLNVLEQIEQSSKSWNMQIFEAWCGKFDVWLVGLKELASNRDSFLEQIELNLADKKVSKLRRSELLM